MSHFWSGYLGQSQLTLKKRLISKKGSHYGENLKNLRNFFLVVWKLAQIYHFWIG